MNRTLSRVLTVCFLVVVMGISARGQIAWVTPDSSALTPGGMVTVSVGAGSDFGTPVVALPSTAVQSASIWLAGQPIVPGQFFVSDKMLKFYFTPSRPGVATVVIDLKAKPIVLAPEHVERHLRSLYASEELRAIWHGLPAGTTWRESRVERLKTFVRVGQPASDDRGWAKIEGEAFDIVPDVDPTAVHQGELFAVRVVSGRRPVPHTVVSFASQDQTREHVVATDEDGKASATLDAAGNWLVRALDVQHSEGSDHEWTVRTAAVTCLVR